MYVFTFRIPFSAIFSFDYIILHIVECDAQSENVL